VILDPLKWIQEIFGQGLPRHRNLTSVSNWVEIVCPLIFDQRAMFDTSAAGAVAGSERNVYLS